MLLLVTSPQKKPLDLVRIFYISALLPALLTFGCASEPATERLAEDPEPFHPMMSAIPADSEVDYVLRKSIDPGAASALAPWFRETVPVVLLGVGEGDSNEMIGTIQDAAFMPDGSVVVLDGAYRHVKHFALDGQLLRVYGRQGQGPGELDHVWRLDVDEKGGIWVLDRRRRVTRFHPDTPTEAHSFTIELSGEDFCVMNDEVYVRGYSSESDRRNLVRVYSSDGAYLRSFGEPYRAQNEAAAERVSQEGYIACDPASGSVLASYRWHPLAHGFSKDGKLRWTDKVSLETIFRFEARGDVLHFGPLDPGTQSIAGVLVAAAGQFLLSVYRIRGQDDESPYEHHLIDGNTGRSIGFLGSELTIYDMNATHVLRRQKKAYPQLGVFRIRDEV